MPQVPDQFVPSATVSPLGVSPVSAQPVQPMRNAAPGQEQQAGADVQKLGEVTNDIGERIQNQLDSSMAKQADTGFAQKIMDIASGDGTTANPGFLNMRGQAAVNALPSARAAIVKAKNDFADGLADDFQKSMFNRVATQRLVSIGREMADHSFQQGTAWAIQANDDRATMTGLQQANAHKSWNETDADGNPSGDYTTFGKLQDQEILDGQNQKNGTHDDLTTPLDKMAPQSQFALLQAHSTTAKVVLAQMITAQDPATEVQGYFDAMKAKGNIDARDEVAMAGAVKSYIVPKNLNDSMNQAFTDAYRANHPQAANASGPSDYQGLVKGAGFTTSPYDEDAEGVHVTIPQNSQVHAPGSGTVSAVGKNDHDVPFISISHSDGYTSTLTGMSTFNVKAGDVVKMGQQIGSSGDSGNQKNPSVLWQLSDKNEAYIDPTHAGLPAVQPQNITDEKDLTDAIQLFRDRETDPDLQREGTGEMEGLFRHSQAIVAKGLEQNHQTALGQFYADAIQHGGNFNTKSVDPALFHSLTPEQQYSMINLVTEQRKRALAEAQAAQNALQMPGNIGARFWLATNPFYTMDDLTKLGPNLTPDQMIEAAKNFTTRDVKQAPIDQMQLHSALTQAGLQGLFDMAGQKDVDQKLASQQRYLGIQDDVQKIFDDAQAANKKPLGPADRQGLLNDYLINNQVMVPQTAWYRSNSNHSQDLQVNYANLTADQKKIAYENVGGAGGSSQMVPLSKITPDQHDSIAAALIRAHQAPTMANIAKVWNEQYGGK